ncbi:nucleotide disphospho-sugar-binding domain-containing protein [Salinispora arenicola]|uniref:nucleotide disphospho-sugar-binding domain-containing protein n=1 Tax=Salinispora arenicola TaxID=168697 RepID=UPI000360E514|nr:nucleotide disphospho-sugar-binding domain-containing protein [Salinispora arenicola]
MRILFTVFPSYVHLYPLAPVAWALQSVGHEVRVASSGNFARAISSVGLTPLSLGDPDAVEARLRPGAKQPPNPQEVLAYADLMGLDSAERENWIVFYQWLLNPVSDYVRVDQPEAAHLVRFAQRWQPDLVLWDPIFPAGAVAARACGAAHGRFLGAALDYFMYSTERLEAARDKVRSAGLSDNPLADLIRPLADHHNVDVDDELLRGQWTVDPMPEGVSLSTGGHKVPVRWVPYVGGEPYQEWVLDGPTSRPRVVLSLGESARRYVAGDWGRTPKLLDALAGMDVDVIATLNERQLQGISTVPDNVRVIEWVPLTQLMPTSSLLIHHGGTGTTMSALANRVPQLVCDTDESFLMGPADVVPRLGDAGVYRAGREFGVTDDDADGDAEQEGWVIPGRHLMAPPWSGVMTHYGAGERLNHQVMSGTEIRDRITHVLSEPSFAAGARELYEEWMARPSPSDIVSTLESLTAEHRR